VSIQQQKADLRARFKSQRQRLTLDDWQMASVAVCGRLLALPEVLLARTVHLYWPMAERGELSTLPLLDVLHGRGSRVVLPVVTAFEGEPKLEHRLYTGPDCLQVNRWGIAEPHGTEQVDPAGLDAIVVPALGADRRGYRVGYGRGFYDAFLGQTDAFTACAVYAEGLLDHVPNEPHDVATHAVVTERETVRAR
jgi:5-formyltetrahydrofolate cyclo-ligase